VINPIRLTLANNKERSLVLTQSTTTVFTAIDTYEEKLTRKKKIKKIKKK
jgi:formylmethanofuran:tetrahydromethanopterin formyltransferase